MVLRAQSIVDVAEPNRLLAALCSHYAEHGAVSQTDDAARIVVSFGEAHFRLRDGRLHIEAESVDETGLAYMKMGVTSHLREFAPEPPLAVRWQGDGAVGVAPPFFRAMQVRESRRLTPHMQRITLCGQDLARFATGGLHVRLAFPPQGRAPVWPVMAEDGIPVWPQGDDQFILRVYTIRSIDLAAQTVEIDMVVHPGVEAAPGSDFALAARPGDVVGMVGPGGGFLPECDDLLLLGDETALPAIARILEAAPPQTRATAYIEVDGPAEEQILSTRAQAQITYLHRNGAEAGTTTLLADALMAQTRDGISPQRYVWAAGEFSAFRAMRRHMRQTLAHPKDRHMVATYWRRGLAGDAARKGTREPD
ncbi:siderophore-interacting protein [Aureimonas frigidaquae]|uniref:siderophore-interacting protein n=1 Tax=Aureimonas frigidaquae TaxID=424757 RepID=UPI000781A6B8|nr:siderophore-interacting protein [Aureimonas frigidaquae]